MIICCETCFDTLAMLGPKYMKDWLKQGDKLFCPDCMFRMGKDGTTPDKAVTGCYANKLDPRTVMCELCYRQQPLDGGTHIPATWDIVFQSPICPDCQRRAEADGKAIAHLTCGCYSGGKPDPRARFVAEAA
jgi:hypothetical protein